MANQADNKSASGTRQRKDKQHIHKQHKNAMVFNKLVSFQIDYAPQYHLTKFISSRSRLQLIHINSNSSPLVQGYFALATECPTDSGVPHTLEHLIFMGSRKFPFKGLLDTAGNLCMSSTNAWTATDQTVYTLTSAGWLGFKKLLPVYLDHVLNPTLTDEACCTEVYHVDPESLEDKGVVFSEMEGIESQSWFVTMLEKQKQMFPEGSGYRSETGGLTKNLRELTNKEIRQFHKEMYSPDNLCLIVCGNVPEHELLQIMEEFDAALPECTGPRKRPFVDSVDFQIPARLSQAVETEVEFPELDESQGEIVMSWIGEAYTSHLNDLAVSVLLDYFTDTALAPFNKQLVEIDNPYANAADYWTDDFMRTIVNLTFHGVPTDRLEETRDKVFEILAHHKVDLRRMKQVVENGKWDYVIKCEKNGSTILSQACITDFLYGDDDCQILKDSLRNLADFDALLQWNQAQWQDLLENLFLANKPVVVLGRPSAEMYARLEREQAERIQKRKRDLGDAGRRDLQEKLESAQKHNNQPIPESTLAEFVVENPAQSVEFITTKGITTIGHEFNDMQDELTRRVLESRPDDFPLFIHLDHFPSQFVELHVLVNSTTVKDTTLLPFYHIFCELFSMPMETAEGKLVPYEDVVSQLKSETVDSQITLGLRGEFPDLIDFRIQCRAKNYPEAVKWVKHCLFDMVFDEKRVTVLLEKFLNSIVELKREGDLMMHSLINRHFFSERTAKKSTDELFVEELLGDVLDDIENGKYEEKVLPRLNTMREQLRSNFRKFHILVFGDVEKLGNVYEPWTELVGRLEGVAPGAEVVVPPVPRLAESLSLLGKNPRDVAYVITTPASESSYMTALTSMPLDLDYHHPDFAPITLAAEYLQCVEGPFWKGIRGSGLAYGANMAKMTESNALGFSVYRGADIVKCYQKAKAIVNDYASGTTKFDPQLVKGAISSIINGIASSENGYLASALMKYIDDFCKKRGPNFNKVFLSKLGKVTTEDLERVMAKYFVDIFDSENGVVFISCHPGKLDAVKEFLEKEGYAIALEELEEDEEDCGSDGECCNGSEKECHEGCC